MEIERRSQTDLAPAAYAEQALNAIDVSEARRKKRKRDTRSDLTGMNIKRGLLEGAIHDQPAPDEFEGWLMEQVFQAPAGGPIRAMAMEVLADYENARLFHSFNNWLADGAPTPKVGETPQKKTTR